VEGSAIRYLACVPSLVTGKYALGRRFAARLVKQRATRTKFAAAPAHAPPSAWRLFAVHLASLGITASSSIARASATNLLPAALVQQVRAPEITSIIEQCALREVYSLGSVTYCS